MSRVAPRGWSTREGYSSSVDEYQMQCGHYQKKGVYACNDCNLAPLSDNTALHKMLTDLVDVIKRPGLGTTAHDRVLARAESLLESLD